MQLPKKLANSNFCLGKLGQLLAEAQINSNFALAEIPEEAQESQAPGNMFNGQYAEDSISSRPEIPVMRVSNSGQARPQEPVSKSQESDGFNTQLEKLER